MPTATPTPAPSEKLMAATTAPRLKMVGWYDPLQLVQTGIRVAISTIFGRYSDHRLVEALASSAHEIYDYTCHYRENDQGLCERDTNRRRESIWIDYVGDVGDGWNSTYTIAYYLVQPMQSFTYHDEAGRASQATTYRGDILIFGGDEVYPAAGRDAYERRLLGPYRSALRYTTQPPFPHVFAVPGNHDWYDSLVAFTRLFTARQWFGGWRARQSRSYFALKLPHGWWLLGTDVQLGSDIDRPQVEYFKRVAKEIQEGDHIVLCNAEPHWIYTEMYRELDPTYNESNLAFLEKTLGKKVAVFIAGDLHHYRRHQATDGSFTQKITAGGGGAFLHPTHTGRLGTDVKEIQEDEYDRGEMPSGRTFRQIACFPSEEASRRLCWQNLYFPYLKGNASWTFGFATAALYGLTTLSIIAHPERFVAPGGGFGRVIAHLSGAAFYSVLHWPLTLLWMLVTLLGFVLFTDTHSKRYRLVAGPIHGLGHIIAACAVALGSTFLVANSTSIRWVLAFSWGAYA